jgi:hypothetical protein
MAYHTNCGPARGPILDRTVPDAIGVLAEPGYGMPIGLALATERDDQRRMVWRLIVHGVEVPGKWIVIDREFRPVQ